MILRYTSVNVANTHQQSATAIVYDYLSSKAIKAAFYKTVIAHHYILSGPLQVCNCVAFFIQGQLLYHKCGAKWVSYQLP